MALVAQWHMDLPFCSLNHLGIGEPRCPHSLPSLLSSYINAPVLGPRVRRGFRMQRPCSPERSTLEATQLANDEGVPWVFVQDIWLALLSLVIIPFYTMKIWFLIPTQVKRLLYPHLCRTSFRLTWKPAPGLLSHPEVWVVMTRAGFAFVDLEGFTPVQAWNSCLEQRTRSQSCTGAAIPLPDSPGAAALPHARPCPLLRPSAPGGPYPLPKNRTGKASALPRRPSSGKKQVRGRPAPHLSDPLGNLGSPQPLRK